MFFAKFQSKSHLRDAMRIAYTANEQIVLANMRISELIFT